VMLLEAPPSPLVSASSLSSSTSDADGGSAGDGLRTGGTSRALTEVARTRAMARHRSAGEEAMDLKAIACRSTNEQVPASRGSDHASIYSPAGA
jgi:hypothetical protein